MQIEGAIRLYLRALQGGSYKNIMKLFEKSAAINSPLYGKIKAADFYRKLLKDTKKSRISLLHIFKGKGAGAAHFRYNWMLKDGTLTSFECVDIFRFSKNSKIKHLTIIYDTFRTRQSFKRINSMK